MALKTKVNKSYIRVRDKSRKIEIKLSYVQWALLYHFDKYQLNQLSTYSNVLSVKNVAPSDIPLSAYSIRSNNPATSINSLASKELVEYIADSSKKAIPYTDSWGHKRKLTGYLLTDLGKEVKGVLPAPRRDPKIKDAADLGEDLEDTKYCSASNAGTFYGSRCDEGSCEPLVSTDLTEKDFQLFKRIYEGSFNYYKRFLDTNGELNYMKVFHGSNHRVTGLEKIYPLDTLDKLIASEYMYYVVNDYQVKYGLTELGIVVGDTL